MKAIGVYFFVCLLQLASQAQLVKSHSIYFVNNSFKLTHEHKLQIDSLISTLANIPEGFTIETIGHTDNNGSLEFNYKLSKKRAENVLRYFKSKKFNATDSSLKYQAYKIPQSSENSSKNRRVEINIYPRNINITKAIGIKINNEKTYQFEVKDGGTLLYNTTTIIIPPNAFTDKKGADVKGKVDVKYIEYRTPTDFLLSGIPMSINTPDGLQPFHSAGMFSIKVYQNGEEVQFKKSSSEKINIEFPLSDIENQQFFTLNDRDQTWNNDAPLITDSTGEIAPQFTHGVINNNVLAIDTSYVYLKYVVEKLQYFATHEEPMIQGEAYKFIKNYLVDFKTPYYRTRRDNKHLIIESLNKHNDLGPLKEYSWRENSPNRSTEECLQKIDSIRMFSGKLQFEMACSASEKPFRVFGRPSRYKYTSEYNSFLKYIFSGKLKKMRKEIKNINAQNYNDYVAFVEGLKLNHKSLSQELEVKVGDFNICKQQCEDSLKMIIQFCEKLFPYVTDPNSEKARMKTYISLFKSPFDYENTKSLIKKQVSITPINYLEASRLKNTFVKFGISQTGIYNADAIKKIEQPLEVLASYKDVETSQQLKITSIYISIKGLNGIINYNGYCGYGPCKFICSESCKCLLIAVSSEGHVYYCSPDEFNLSLKQKKGNNIDFNLHQLPKIESVDGLEKIMAIN